MSVFVAKPLTVKSSRYLQQLCKHWRHKFAVEFDADRGVIELSSARLCLLAHEDHLEIQINPYGGADVEKLKDVVVRHIDRFAFREAPLQYTWQETG